ncbi:hypothetical protein ACFB49_36070 [Sphingomonas sp. DBB INV C78]|uniref:DUF6438 domain-containing protein n=1 Tax=Sphingomonas sp. DBB INV C78 TaxID=3349434 RepID=UPI0036D41A24
MRGFITAAGAMMLLALGAAPARANNDVAAGLAEITIAAGPCFGSCPVYSSRITPIGAVRFVGTRFVAKPGEQTLTADADTFREIAEMLAPYRPTVDRRIGPEECDNFRTDAPSWTVQWTDKAGATVSLAFSLGCTDMRYLPIADAIKAANDLLPIAPLVAKPAR